MKKLALFLACGFLLAACAPAAPSSGPTQAATHDLRVIDISPKQLVITSQDLPVIAKYYHPAGWAYGPVTNSEIVSTSTAEEGQAYLARSGRVYGWETEFGRGSPNFVLPEKIWDEAVLYKTGAAAKASVEEGMDCTRFNGPQPVKVDFTIGDASVICMERTDDNGVAYLVVFSHRNVLGMLQAWGSEAEVTPEILRGIAEKQLAKMMRQPLSKEVTFSP